MINDKSDKSFIINEQIIKVNLKTLQTKFIVNVKYLFDTLVTS